MFTVSVLLYSLCLALTLSVCSNITINLSLSLLLLGLSILYLYYFNYYLCEFVCPHSNLSVTDYCCISPSLSLSLSIALLHCVYHSLSIHSIVVYASLSIAYLLRCYLHQVHAYYLTHSLSI